MQTAIVWEQRKREPYTTEQDSTFANNAKPALNLSVVYQNDQTCLVTQLRPPRPQLKIEPDPKQESRRDGVGNGNRAIELCLCEIGPVKRLTPREEVELVARIKRGDRKARERLIKANLRRVVKISREYENIGLPLLDLVSEGNVGLMKAVERFDPTNGSGFSPYSAWWIKRSIKRALAELSSAIPLVQRVQAASQLNAPEIGCQRDEEDQRLVG